LQQLSSIEVCFHPDTLSLTAPRRDMIEQRPVLSYQNCSFPQEGALSLSCTLTVCDDPVIPAQPVLALRPTRRGWK
jgi:hypothetical protein